MTYTPDNKIFAENAKKDELLEFPDPARGWGITLEQTGDKPPLEWMNGAFNRIDKIQQYQSMTGAHHPFNQTFCDAIGGYPKGSIILGSDSVTLWQSTVDGNTTDPDSAGASGWLVMPSRQSIIDLIDEPLIGNLQFRASVAEGDGWLRLPEKSTSVNANISRTQYGKLFAKIGTTYGAGDGSTTFGLPTILDSTGEFSCFLRPMLASGTIGAKHGDMIRNITGKIGVFRNAAMLQSNSNGAFSSSNLDSNARVVSTESGYNGTLINFDASRQVPTGSENTPKYIEYPIFIFAGRNPA